ncbi:LuxR C-terminal-related transcriptional regulator [Kitasatospora phosalacinea]|uniref:LuxR C-terminal-related transcriptional regulator n=1 Tax=Kitasatospora phosalacinea TaxID=2065 RepID=A0ABW6GL71_9ACTN
MSITDTLSPPGRSSCPAAAGPVPACDHAWDAVLARVPLLSERELDVFRLLAKGASNRTIAARLLITERTAKAHVAQILSKLGVESRLQAGIAGFAWEMLSPAADRAVDLSA